VKRQADADLQQDYLDAMELTVQHATADSASRAAEFLSKWAAELSEHSGVEFAELKVIALLNLCRMREQLQQNDEAERSRHEAITLFDHSSEPGNKVNIEDRLADVLVEFGEYRRAIRPCEQAIKLSRGGAVRGSGSGYAKLRPAPR